MPMTASIARPLLAVAATILDASCAVPPRSERPPLRDEAPLAGVDVPAGAGWPSPDWWTRYGDAQLDRLEELALARSPSLQEAQRRFGAAVQAVDIARAAEGLSGEASAQVQRQRLSEHGLIPSQFLGFTWYNQGDLAVSVRHDFDFWGRSRAAIAASIDEARAAEAERAAAALMLTSAVAETYLAWAADHVRLALAAETVAALERSRAIGARRVARGIEPPDLLQQADARIAAAAEQRAAESGAVRIRLAALAALLGTAPAELADLEPPPLPAVGGALPDDAGLDLLARRPDIAASRWRIEAALERTEQARAAFYPDISLGAMAGLSSIDLDRLLAAGSRVAAFGPALHLPLFGRDRLRAAHGASQAQLEAAAAHYDAVVVDAAREVARQALLLAQLDARRSERARQLDASRALERSAAARVRHGIVDERVHLEAVAGVLQQRDAMAALDAQRLAAEIALTRALGGGYHQPSPAEGDRPAAAADRTPDPAATPSG